VSRQREFLADASAVQFTRNPEGIAGALKRIGAAVFGSKLVSPRAAEASHMYFAQGISGLFATHPPLEERIRRLDPAWDGKFPPPLPADALAAFEADESAAGFAVTAAGDVTADPRVPAQSLEHAAQQVGNPTEIHRVYVRQLLATIPPAIREAAQEPYGARALVYAFLLDRDADIRAKQLLTLEQWADDILFELTLRLAKPVNQLDVRARLPVIDMMLPALRALSPSQYQEFARCFDQLVRADERFSLFEWMLHQILLRHLRPQFEPVHPPQIRYYGLQRLAGPCSVLLSALARESRHNDAIAFDAGARRLGEVAVRLLPPEESGLRQLQEALQELAHTAPKQRARLIEACGAAICADFAVNPAEAELLRAICDMLDCPLPPLLPGQAVPSAPGV
jgi:hypothetical protein